MFSREQGTRRTVGTFLSSRGKGSSRGKARTGQSRRGRVSRQTLSFTSQMDTNASAEPAAKHLPVGSNEMQ